MQNISNGKGEKVGYAIFSYRSGKKSGTKFQQYIIYNGDTIVDDLRADKWFIHKKLSPNNYDDIQIEMLSILN